MIQTKVIEDVQNEHATGKYTIKKNDSHFILRY